MNDSGIQSMILGKRYKEILHLEGKKYSGIKCIAAIKLKDFDIAMEYAPRNSFESSYIYYRTKNFKKSLKIVGKLDQSLVKVKLLTAQCYWNLGKYGQSYDVLSSIPFEQLGKKGIVNLVAIQSQMSAEEESERRMIDFSALIKPSVNLVECQYNLLFKFIREDGVDVFAEKLERLFLDYHDMKKYDFLTKQLINLCRDEIPDDFEEYFTVKEKELFYFNTTRSKKPSHLHPFQYRILILNNICNGRYQSYERMNCHGIRELILWKVCLGLRSRKIAKVIDFIRNTIKHNYMVLSSLDLQILNDILVCFR